MSSDQPPSSPPPGAPSLWGSYGGGSSPAPSPARGGSSGGGLDPLSRRLMQGVKFLALLLVLVLVNSFVNGDDGPSSEQLELNPVASAAERVEEFPGGRMSLYIVYSSPTLPGPLAASGSGEFNEETDRSRITLNMRNPLTGQSMQMVQISDGDVEYDGGDIVAEELPPGKEWVRTEEEDEEDGSELSFEDSMELLASPDTFKLVGRESINGKMTHHYRSEVKIDDLVDYLRERGKDEKADAYEEIQDVTPTEIRAEGWVDGENLLRRLRMVMPTPGEDGDPPMTIDMRMDFFDYGATPDIQIPDPDTVVEGPLEDDESAPAPASVS